MQITDNIPGHRDRQRERATETRIERRTYTRIISYNIAEQWEKLPIIYPYTNTNREKCTCTESERKSETYPDTGADIQSQRERETEVQIKRRTYTRSINNNQTYIFWSVITHWPSWTPLFTYMHITNNIPGHWERQRYKEIRRKRGIRDVPIYELSVTENIAEYRHKQS